MKHVDFYMIATLVMILVVIIAVIAAGRLYQRVRQDTGYHQGKFYMRRQHMGAFFGNHQMNRLGVKDNDGRIETDEEMFLFSESENEKKS